MTVVVLANPVGYAVADAGEFVVVVPDPVAVDAGGEVAVSEMRVPVREYTAAQAASDSPWWFLASDS
jgi:hypothetical protein